MRGGDHLVKWGRLHLIFVFHLGKLEILHCRLIISRLMAPDDQSSNILIRPPSRSVVINDMIMVRFLGEVCLCVCVCVCVCMCVCVCV
jgi:hypothetical protein